MLEKRDLTFAFGLHLFVVVLIAIVNTWHIKHQPKVERLIQVNMVSLKELQAMMAKTKPAAKPKSKPIIKQKKKPKPKKKTNQKEKAVVSPKRVSKPKKKVVEEEPDFDPFAPLESTPQKTTHTTKNTTNQKRFNDLLKGQLSDKALNRYIVGMQKAVESHWKVPMEMMDKVQPAWVELTLSRTGQVVKVSILESSGSSLLDETLLKAIHAAAPFQLPDRQFELFKTNKIRFYPLQ